LRTVFLIQIHTCSSLDTTDSQSCVRYVHRPVSSPFESAWKVCRHTVDLQILRVFTCNQFWSIVVRRDIDQRKTYSYVFGRRIYDDRVGTCMNESYILRYFLRLLRKSLQTYLVVARNTTLQKWLRAVVYCLIYLLTHWFLLNLNITNLFLSILISRIKKTVLNKFSNRFCHYFLLITTCRTQIIIAFKICKDWLTIVRLLDHILCMWSCSILLLGLNFKTLSISFFIVYCRDVFGETGSWKLPLKPHGYVLKFKPNKSILQDHIQKTTGKFVILKDIHSMASSRKRADEANLQA
jgi:hypothetical protein